MTHTRCVTTSGAYLISFVWPPLAKSAAHYQIKDDRLKLQISMFSCSTWSPSASWREPPMPRPWSYLQLGFRLFFVLISCNLATPGTNPKLSLFAGGGGGDGSSTRLSHIVRKSCWGARVTSSEKAGEEDAATFCPFLIGAQFVGAFWDTSCALGWLFDWLGLMLLYSKQCKCFFLYEMKLVPGLVVPSCQELVFTSDVVAARVPHHHLRWSRLSSLSWLG